MKKIVLLSASWCGPCQILKQRLKNENISVDIVDIDDEVGSNLVKRFSIKSVPTLVEYYEDAPDMRDHLATIGADNIVERLKKNV